MELKLTSNLPPSVNHYLGYRVVIKNGRPMAVSYITNEAAVYKKAFTEYVIDQVEEQKWDMEPNKYQHFYVDTVFYFDRVGKDCNNYFKVMLDAITDTQLIWLDDDVVCERVQRIYYDPQNPRIDLTIRPVEYIGVFDNASQLEEFERSCFSCTRDKNKCSVMKKALSGKIQDCVIGSECKKYKQRKRDRKNVSKKDQD